MTIEDRTGNELVPLLHGRLVGRRVVTVEQNPDTEHKMFGSVLRLDDGTMLRLFMSDQDCCASADGAWVIQPGNLDAMITDVRYEQMHGDREEDGGVENRAIVTILHNQNPVAVAECYANAGNGGYYYSVMQLHVTNVIDTTGKHDLMFTVVSSS